jgi:hypothetical protein
MARKEAARLGPRVLIATSLGGHEFATTVESALAVALTLRGANVDVLLCDGVLPACQLSKLANLAPEQVGIERPQPRCTSCRAAGDDAFSPLGLTVHHLGEFLTPEQRSAAREMARSVPLSDLGEFRVDGLAVGEHALAGALRYFAVGSLDAETSSEQVLRTYVEAALLTATALDDLLARIDYDVACFHHGIYVPQGPIGEQCRKQGIRVVNWNPAYRRSCFIFSHGDTYHHTMLSEPVETWEDMVWDDERERTVMEYLGSRAAGTNDWIWFHERPTDDIAEFVERIGLDANRSWIGLLTNVMWDARLHYPSNAFPDMLDWVLKTIDYFARRPELQLIIRAHPGEVRGQVPSRQPIADEIRRAYPVLPANVFVIEPDDPISTYALMARCNVALIYNTKTGIELSAMGTPVIVAGEAWIRGKGFSTDITCAADYFDALNRLPLPHRLNDQLVDRARKYAFHVFFRRMIELPFFDSDGFSPRLKIDALTDLDAGRFPGLDVICDGIMNGKPFMMQAHEYTAHSSR